MWRHPSKAWGYFCLEERLNRFAAGSPSCVECDTKLPQAKYRLNATGIEFAAHMCDACVKQRNERREAAKQQIREEKRGVRIVLGS